MFNSHKLTYYIYFPVLALIWLSCQNPNNNSQQHATQHIDSIAIEVCKSPYRYYVSTSSNDVYELYLNQSDSTSISGHIYHPEIGVAHLVPLGHSGDTVVMELQVSTTNDSSPIQLLHLLAGKDTMWVSISQDYKVIKNLLFTIYQDVSLPFYHFRDTTSYNFNNEPDGAFATMTTKLLRPCPKASKSFSQFLQAQWPFKMTPRKAFNQCFQDYQTSYFKAYDETLLADSFFLKTQVSDHPSYNFTQDFEQSLFLVVDNIVVTSVFEHTFTGGAHGNYLVNYHHFDLNQNKIWDFKSVFGDTSQQLIEIISNAIHQKFSTQPNAKEWPYLVSDFTMSNSFYVTQKGVTFIYNPYELMAYAYGIVEIPVTYDQLMPVLTSEFKTRLQFFTKP